MLEGLTALKGRIDRGRLRQQPQQARRAASPLARAMKRAWPVVCPSGWADRQFPQALRAHRGLRVTVARRLLGRGPFDLLEPIGVDD
jgi:hypothetical protein